MEEAAAAACPSLWSPPSSILQLFLIEGIIPSFFHLKNDDPPPLFFSTNNNFSICTCMALHWLCSLSTSSLSFLISICWAFASRFDMQRAASWWSCPSRHVLGLLVVVLLNEPPLQSSCLFSLVCSEKRTWITALTGNRSFWAAWRDASGESFRLSINLQTSFLSCFETPGCVCNVKKENNNIKVDKSKSKRDVNHGL